MPVGSYALRIEAAGFKTSARSGVELSTNENARVDETYIARLLPQLPAGDSELYSHPSLDEFKNEFDALVSPLIRNQIEKLGIKLIRYQDL